MSKDKHRFRRLSDFEKRKIDDAANVFVTTNRNWEYIPVHPMANEADWLKRNGLKASDCIRVDCYWKLDGDVLFLQVHSIKSGWNRPPGLYARWDEKGFPMLYIDAVVEEPYITQSLLEEVMGRIDTVHQRQSLFADESIGQELSRLEKE